MLDMLLGQRGAQQQPQNPSGQNNGNPTFDLLGMAGLMGLGNNKSLGENLLGASQVQHMQQQQQAQMAEYQQKQQQQMKLQQLGEYLSTNPNASVKDIMQLGIQLGVKPENIANFATTFSPPEKYQAIQDKFSGTTKVLNTKTGRYTNDNAAAQEQARSESAGGTPSSRKSQTGIRGSEDLGQNSSMTNRALDNSEIVNNQSTFNETTPYNQYDEGEGRVGTPTNEQELPKPVELEGPSDKEFSEVPTDKQNIVESFLENNPPSNKPVSVDQQKIHLNDYYKRREKEFAPKLEAAGELLEGLNSMSDALSKFTTGITGEERLKVMQLLGEYTGLSNPQSVAAGELIRKVANKMVLDFAKQMGGGVVSDKDIKFLKEMVPGLAVSPEGNRQIIEYFQRAAERIADRSLAFDAYYQAHGNTVGFDSKWYNEVRKRDVFNEEDKKAARELIKENKKGKTTSYSKEEIQAEKARRANAQ